MTHGLDEFEKIAEWMEANLRVTHDRLVENVRFISIQWTDNLDLFVTALKAKVGNELANVPGFVCDIALNMVTVVEDQFAGAYRGDIFINSLPIRQINQCSQASGGRASYRWIVSNTAEHPDGLVTLTEPKRETIEETARYKFRVYMKAEDWPDLSDSYRVRKLLMKVA